MEFSIKQSSSDKQASGCLVVGVYADGVLSPAAQVLDAALQGQLAQLVARGDMSGAVGQTLLLPSVNGIEAERVLLVGLGRAEDLGHKQFLDALRAVYAALHKTTAKDAALYLTDVAVQGRDMAWNIQQTVLLATESVYRSDKLKSKPADAPTLRKLLLACTDKPGSANKQVLARAIAVAHGMKLTKDLANLPGNVCTPTYLAEQAKSLGKHYKFDVEVLEESDMDKLGMHSLLSVARGSRQPAKLISLNYHGGDKKQKPIVLVGKGITFDSGGISLKPGAEMDEMKYDMCGAATVLGVLRAIAEMELKLNVVGVIPSCENMPGGDASKPGDIVKSMSGQTIEILNTDAEGRLILCDALTYAARFEPATVIDIATLTGACVIALGHVASGLLSNQDDLAQELLAAGQYTQDRAWQLPLWDDYQAQLDSNFADMQNIGGRAGGTITAACFLARFTKDYRWAHLDIAGTAWKSGKDKGATGRPVPLLTEYLVKQAG